MFEYSADLIRVVDGDTIDLEVDLGFSVCIRERFRLNRINAPEVRGSEKELGLAAGEWLESVLVNPLKIKTIRDKKEKFGRYLVEIYDSQGQCINDLMVHAGHAVYAQY